MAKKPKTDPETLTFSSLVEAIDEKWGHTYEPLTTNKNQESLPLALYIPETPKVK
jgi:hypothetical protein